MPSDAEQLATIKSQTLALIATITAEPKPSYEIDDQRVIIRQASRGGKMDDPFRTFSEWNSEADARAYGDL